MAKADDDEFTLTGAATKQITLNFYTSMSTSNECLDR
eukprot:COSAG01_NODE_404_length_17467_cov_69.758650_5_plen_37_part_00